MTAHTPVPLPQKSSGKEAPSQQGPRGHQHPRPPARFRPLRNHTTHPASHDQNAKHTPLRGVLSAGRMPGRPGSKPPTRLPTNRPPAAHPCQGRPTADSPYPSAPAGASHRPHRRPRVFTRPGSALAPALHRRHQTAANRELRQDRRPRHIPPSVSALPEPAPSPAPPASTALPPSPRNHTPNRPYSAGAAVVVVKPWKWPLSTCPAIASSEASENGFSTKATLGSSLPWEARTGRA